MSLGPFENLAADLAPGDRRVLDADWAAFEVVAVENASDPLFEQAYERMWREFGDRGEMERREVIAERLGWRPERPTGGRAMLYELRVVRRDDSIVAVRDHTAITTPNGAVIVHLSHVLVEPAMRGYGLASWLRALPMQTARRCAAAIELPEAGARPVTLVAEMEHDDGSPAVRTRLRSYAKAGFRVVDPQRVPYQQPDFRCAAEIDRTAVQSVPLSLVVRRVGKENESRMPGDELREMTDALYAMFGVHVRADHMSGVRAAASGFPCGREWVSLPVPIELAERAAREAAR